MKRPKLYLPKKGDVATMPEKKYDNLQTAYMGKDSRDGRLHSISTDRGDFRFKDDRKE